MSRLPKKPILQVKNRGGAPKSNRNALKTGLHTKERRAWRAKLRDVLLRAKLVLAQLDG
jgi:hypothetical protein